MHRKITSGIKKCAIMSAAASLIVGLSAGIAASQDKTHRIAMVTGLISQPFYVDMQKGAEEEARKLGVKLEYNGASVWDPANEIPVLDAVRATKPDFLIAVPVNDTALVQPLKQFVDQGIPVTTIDTDVKDKSVRMVNFTSDNYNGGIMAAEMLAESVGEKGKVALLCYNPGITVNDQRRSGFETTIKKYPNVEYVGAQLMTDSNDTDTVLPPLLRSQPELAGVAACDGNSAARAMAIIGETGRPISLIGFDVDADLLAGLKAGRISGLAVQQTQEMAAVAVKWAYDYLEGKKPAEKDVVLPFVKVTKQNLDDAEVKKVVGIYEK